MHPTKSAYQFLAATVEVQAENLFVGIRRYNSLFNANLMASGKIDIDPASYGTVAVKVNGYMYGCNVRTVNSCGYEPTGCILEGRVIEGSPLHGDYFGGLKLYAQVELDRLHMDRIAGNSFVECETNATQGIVMVRCDMDEKVHMTTSREYALLNELFNQRKPR